MKRILFSLLIFGGFTAGALAQQTGNIVGRVRDESGAAIPGATITLTNDALASKRTVESNEQGEYNASSLEPGAYTLAVEKAGFQKLNAFNRANFNNPNATIGTANAGVISSTLPARILQVALKVSF